MVYKVIGYALGYFTIYPKKDENLPIVKNIMNWLQLQHDIKVRVVCSNGKIDYIKTKRWLNCKDIDFERYAPNIYKQNDIAETVGKTIIAKARVIRLSKRFFHTLWKEIIKATVYLYNKTP